MIGARGDRRAPAVLIRPPSYLPLFFFFILAFAT